MKCCPNVKDMPMQISFLQLLTSFTFSSGFRPNAIEYLMEKGPVSRYNDLLGTEPNIVVRQIKAYKRLLHLFQEPLFLNFNFMPRLDNLEVLDITFRGCRYTAPPPLLAIGGSDEPINEEVDSELDNEESQSILPKRGKKKGKGKKKKEATGDTDLFLEDEEVPDDIDSYAEVEIPTGYALSQVFYTSPNKLLNRSKNESITSQTSLNQTPRETSTPNAKKSGADPNKTALSQELESRKRVHASSEEPSSEDNDDVEEVGETSDDELGDISDKDEVEQELEELQTQEHDGHGEDKKASGSKKKKKQPKALPPLRPKSTRPIIPTLSREQ